MTTEPPAQSADAGDARPDATIVRIGQAKVRPMLSWVGKRPLGEVRAFPAQLVSGFEPVAREGAVSGEVDWSDWPSRFDRGGLLFHVYDIAVDPSSMLPVAVRITDMLGEEVLVVEARSAG